MGQNHHTFSQNVEAHLKDLVGFFLSVWALICCVISALFYLSRIMPTAPKKPCRRVGCRGFAVTDGRGYCDQHKELVRVADRQRGTSHQRGYGHKWRKEREQYLTDHPLCVACESKGQLTAATVVDHIVPHKGNDKLFWSRSNWQPLCASCHSRKTATEDMGRWDGVGGQKV